MDQLPKPRVSPSRPFLNSGVDYAKRPGEDGPQKYKGYLIIFVCLSTSVIHIDIVTDYTTKAFISVKEIVYPYKRFATRRAVCATIAQRLWHKFHWSRRIEQQELKRRFSSANELRELAFVLEMIQSWNEDASSP